VRIEYAALSDQGRIRKSNEDFFITNPDNMIFLVADGMGGHAAGEIARLLLKPSRKRFPSALASKCPSF